MVPTVVAERQAVSKSRETYARPLAELLNKCLGDTFARQGFASREIVTHWSEIVGHEIAACAEPVRMQWPRNPSGTEPATLVLRVEGPTAIAFCRADPAPVAKALSDFARTTRLLALRGGVLEGQVLDSAATQRLATLPPREELYARLVGGIAAPISGVVNVLAAVPRGLVVALDQVRQQKEAAAA